VLSQQRSLEQKRAARAWDCVQEAKEQKYAREYGALARGAPSDVQANGLGQTLAFWRAKGYEHGQPKGEEHCRLLKDVSTWLCYRLNLAEQTDVVEWIAKQAKTDDYRRATAEAIAFLVWLKRFAEAELPRVGNSDGAES
jgi:CRISPR-associated protein Cmr5